jgi:hypothetical protein
MKSVLKKRERERKKESNQEAETADMKFLRRLHKERPN